MGLIEELIVGSLYAEIVLDQNDKVGLTILHSVINKPSIMMHPPFDLFCKECNESSIFKKVGEDRRPTSSGYGTTGPLKKVSKSELIKDGKYELELVCSRNSGHKILFHFVKLDNKIQKIGQYPSLINVQIDRWKKYIPIIGYSKVKELIRAEGLINHNVGIGSFVYLRRVFETILEKARILASGEDDWDEVNYKSSRLKDRIVLLSNFLPKVLVENAETYSILSKGIHELEEQECLKFFPIMKQVIELSLEEELSKIEKRKIEEELSKNIQSIKKDIS